MLSDAEWRPAELDLICVTTGPGSFTGLRIGVTTAKTLAYATRANVIGVHTLAAIAARVSEPYERLWTVVDAQRQELFVAEFRSGWQQDSNGIPDTRIVGVDDWLAELQPSDSVSGPPLEKLTERLPTGVRTVEPKLWAPDADTVGRLESQPTKVDRSLTRSNWCRGTIARARRKKKRSDGYSVASVSRAAAIVCSISADVCAAETNHASYWLHGR